MLEIRMATALTIHLLVKTAHFKLAARSKTWLKLNLFAPACAFSSLVTMSANI
jgi:hypothetical protein